MLKAILRALDPLPKPVFEPGQILDFGDYVLRLKVNARARRISLRIDNRTGEAVVTAPRPRLLKDAVEFARSRHDWILEKRREQPQVSSFAPGAVICVGGQRLRLAEKPGVISARIMAEEHDSAENDGMWLLVSSGDPKTYARRIERFVRQRALKAVQAETEGFAVKLGATGVKVSLFDAKGRWGSCTPSRKTIRYSWRLILAPPEVLSYVCAHEVGHLRHADHSPKFWAQVAALYGDYKPARQWLKTHGTSLFRYQ